MKRQYLYLTTCFLLIVSCAKDFDDIEKVAQQPEPYESDETTFTTQEAIIYFTGSTECTVDGSYRRPPSQILEDLIIPDVLLEEYDLSEFLPPIGNQGRQGSCVSWATTYYLKSFQERLQTGEPYTTDQILSPAFTYNQITDGICEGTAFRSTLAILMEQGAAPLSDFPYRDDSCNIQPIGLEQAAEANKISGYDYLSGENMVEEMKALILDQKPILISAFLTDEFGVEDDMGLSAYRPHNVDYNVPGGCHAMLVVGYSNENNAFKVVNSWGEDWGDDGFVWIDYVAFENVSVPSASFRVINTAIVTYDL